MEEGKKGWKGRVYTVMPAVTAVTNTTPIIKFGRCQANACIYCVEVLYRLMVKKNINPSTYPLMNIFCSFIKNPMGTMNVEYGTCCELRVNWLGETPGHRKRKGEKRYKGHSKANITSTKEAPTDHTPLFDGCFVLPHHKALICPSFKYVDVLALGHQSNTGEPGLLHGVLHTSVATLFQSQNLRPRTQGGSGVIIDTRIQLSYSHALDNEPVSGQVRVTMLEYNNTDNSKSGGNMTDPNDFQDLLLLMTPKQCDEESKRGTVSWMIVAAPKTQHGDFHIYDRELDNECPSMSTAEQNSHYEFYHNRLPKGGISLDRKGGSNGTADSLELKHFLKLLKLPGGTPRQSRGVIYVVSGKTIHVFYIATNLTERTGKHYAYPMPVPAGQIGVKKCWFEKSTMDDTHMEKLIEVLQLQAESKVCVHGKIKELNRRLQEDGGWAGLVSQVSNKVRDFHNQRLLVTEAIAVQDKTNRILSDTIHKNQERLSLWFLTVSAKLSLVECPLMFHQDKTRKHPDMSTAESFLEPKTLHLAPCKSSNIPTDPPLGRGGAGCGQYVYALLDHSFGETTGWQWGGFRDQHRLPMNQRQFLDWVRHGVQPPHLDHVNQDARLARGRYLIMRDRHRQQQALS